MAHTLSTVAGALTQRIDIGRSKPSADNSATASASTGTVLAVSPTLSGAVAGSSVIFENIRCRFHQFCPLLDQQVTPLRLVANESSRDCQHLRPCSAASRAVTSEPLLRVDLDDQTAKTQATDDAIAARGKFPCQRLRPVEIRKLSARIVTNGVPDRDCWVAGYT